MARRQDDSIEQAEQLTGLRHPAVKAVAWAVAAVLWGLVALSLVSYDPADPPAHAYGLVHENPANWVGSVGALIAHKAFFVIGPGVWLALGAVGVFLFQTLRGKRVDQPALRAAGVALMVCACSGLVAVGKGALVTGYQGPPEGPGGLLGLFLQGELTPRFATLGALGVLGVVFWVGAVLTADKLVLAVPKAVGEGMLRIFNIGKDKVTLVPRPVGVGFTLPNVALPFPRFHRKRVTPRENDVDDDTPMAHVPVRNHRKKKHEEVESIDESAGGYGGTEAIATADDATDKVANYDDPRNESEDIEHACDEEDPADAPGAYVESQKKFDPQSLRAKMAQMPINFAPKVAATQPPPREPDFSGYKFPTLELLEEPEGDFNAELEGIVRDQAYQLEGALREYKIEGEVVGIDSGPVITLFELRLAPGTKVSRIQTVASDLARALRAPNIRIVPNMAGKDTVGIEVPNVKKERVRLKELMSADPDKLQKMKLPMFLGKDASGNPLVADLNAMPHMLIAGTTGSGKSVCMNSIIMSFLYTKRPDEMKLVLVDPKMVEMSQFKSIPHLMCPVVTEMSKAAAILEWAVTKMDERYELLAEVGVRDIASYNTLGWDEIKERMSPATPEEEARIPKKLPYLVFIIDELADLMMTNKEVEAHIVRIAQKARAVGMHLILATQRPQANVVTGLIKSNMPCRVCMKVASGMDSRIVLDSKGGELLLGHGDMLFLSPRSSELVRAQGTLVDDSEIRKTVKFLKEVATQSFEPQLVQMRTGGESESAGSFAERDELFDAAVEVVLDTQRGSVSLLQRRLTIGYSRASRIIEQMEAFGILGGHKTAQAREVLVSADEWAAMLALAEQDAKEASMSGTPAVTLNEMEQQAQAEEAFEASADDDDADADEEYEEVEDDAEELAQDTADEEDEDAEVVASYDEQEWEEADDEDDDERDAA